MLHTILTAIIAGLACAVLIIAIHGLLWQRQWRLSRPQAYTVGTACIGIVLTIWALLRLWNILGAMAVDDRLWR